MYIFSYWLFSIRVYLSVTYPSFCCILCSFTKHDEDEIFRTRPDTPWGPPTLLYNGYWVFTAGKAAELYIYSTYGT